MFSVLRSETTLTYSFFVTSFLKNSEQWFVFVFQRPRQQKQLHLWHGVAERSAADTLSAAVNHHLALLAYTTPYSSSKVKKKPTNQKSQINGNDGHSFSDPLYIKKKKIDNNWIGILEWIAVSMVLKFRFVSRYHHCKLVTKTKWFVWYSIHCVWHKIRF